VTDDVQAQEQRTYPHGVPCWIDTEQPDLAAASRFYGALFGWTFEDANPVGAAGSYLIAKLDGKDAAGADRPVKHDSQAPGMMARLQAPGPHDRCAW
jgi:predicted enzyme related to lactoylglutathione lyase